mmetsp:Transcript_19505/g.27890  ORF Transcript_19505/g.27890 Transcript_19505/m.27890 type:complete len:226 (+) Transcript_19505:46-723(+)
MSDLLSTSYSIQDDSNNMKKKNKCGICKNEGHNKKNCPERSMDNVAVFNVGSDQRDSLLNGNLFTVEVNSSSTTLYETEPVLPEMQSDFQETALEDSLIDPQPKLFITTGKTTQKRRNKKEWNAKNSRLVGQHFAIIKRRPIERRIEGKKIRQNNGSNVRNFFRGHCMMCGRVVSTQCTTCEVYLCCTEDSMQSNCMVRFHTVNDILTCEAVVPASAGEDEWKEP